MKSFLLCLFLALVSVTDFNGRTTTRAQDVVGRVTTVTFPAGDPYATVGFAYTYNDRNWLRMMETRLGTTLKARFDYDNAGDPQTPWAGDRRLSPTGLRRSVQETIGSLTRTVDYDYDSLHRLIKENIQPGTSQAESVDYGPAGNAAGYDLVGNRRSRIASSSLQTAGITSFTGTEFNALDQPTDGRSFDHNGNTTSDSTGASYVYDAQNLLIRRTGGGLPAIELTYDADGNRVKRTVTPAPGAPADVTLFLVDELNPTGYAQVIEERDAGGTTRMSYVYGLDLISQKNSTGVVSYYGYDGLGSVRYLSESQNALITDTYTYDAFGILINQTGSTPNAYRYTGEQYDQHLGMYYLRARYYKPELGRFWTMDTYEGDNEDPLSLHKYLYCHANPINGTDPSGHENLSSMQIATFISVTINGYSAYQNIRQGRYAWAAVDILSMGFGIGGMGGPGALRQLAGATVAGRGVSFAQWAAAARGAQQVSQGVAAFDILMMAMSGASTGATLGPSGGDGDDGDLYHNRMADQYNAELARARARGVQSVSVSGLEHLKTILEQNPVVKWVVTADNKLRIVPKRVGGTEISHAVAAENQAVRAAGEARLRGDVLEINRWSGHYQGQTWSPGQRHFEGMGLPVKLLDAEF